MIPMRCRYRKPRLSRDDPMPDWVSGTLLSFVCDPEGFIHGIIAHVGEGEDGSISQANIDLIQLVKADNGTGA